MAVRVEELFKTEDGRPVKRLTLENESIEFSCLNIGASITCFRERSTGINAVLAYKDPKKYLTNPNYFGCVIGRSSGRIKNAELSIDGKIYQLSKNFISKHNLHTGFHGFQTKMFDVITLNDNKIVLKAISKSGEDGFPGQVTLTITYALTDHELHISYDATCDQKTIINITNHAYFNLNVKNDTILDHELMVNADYYFMLDEEMIPVKPHSVDGSPFDFRKKQNIGEVLTKLHPQLEIAKGIDHPFIINKATHEMNPVARLNNDRLALEIFSDQDAVIVYSGNFLEGIHEIEDGEYDFWRSAICLETQGIPNSQYISGFEDRNIYELGLPYKQRTIWRLTPIQAD